MRRIFSHLTAILLLGFLLLCTVDTVQGCESVPLRLPEWVVKNAEVILRATALEQIEKDRVKFKVTEVLKGTKIPATLIIRGFLNQKDDFNSGTVPYNHVRASGSGPCLAYKYKEGGEFLLLLKKIRHGKLTPYWQDLAPTNEQLRAKDGEWIVWVKNFLKAESNNL